MKDDIVNYLRLSRTRFNRNAEAADEIERLRAEKQMWKATCTKLVGMMLPFSLLMNPTEKEELKIILKEAATK